MMKSSHQTTDVHSGDCDLSSSELLAQAYVPLADLADATVMLVDDEPVMTEVVRTYLEEAGYHRFITVNDPRNVIDLARSNPPGVLLLDLMMPQRSGFDVLAEIRADPDLQFLPVIILTAVTDAAAKLKALELGATDFLSKPVDPSELVLRVRNSLAFKTYQDRLTFYDALTGLPNRRVFLSRLEAAIRRARHDGALFALLHLDVDRFKQINDTLGHRAGDELLKAVAQRLKRGVRDTDILGRLSGKEMSFLSRFGGNEFTVLLAGLEEEENAAAVGRRLLADMEAPFNIKQQELFVNLSIGMSVFPIDGHDTESLVNNAGAALQHAKQTGGNSVQFYSKELNARSLERLTLESQLRRALEREELVLHFQPKTDLATGQVTGAEALLRWTHPQLGQVPPVRFIPVAEQCGLIVPIGEWVMATACRQAVEWATLGLGALSVSVNVSGQQFVDQDILNAIGRALDATGLPANRLVVELTESTLMDDIKVAADMLQRLKNLGLMLSIDDFGTGFSSLSYLKRFPLDEVKIDRSFIIDAPTSETDAAIIKAIVALSRALGLRVVAEGVETHEQRSLLSQLGCDEYQGYLSSKPLPASEFIAFVQSANRTTR